MQCQQHWLRLNQAGLHEAGNDCGTIVSRLLSSFQATLSEMSIIAQPETGGGRDVRLVSYVDPAKGAGCLKKIYLPRLSP